MSIPVPNRNFIDFNVPKLMNHAKSPSYSDITHIIKKLNNQPINNYNNNINPIYNNYNVNYQNLPVQTDFNNYNNIGNNIYGIPNQINYNLNNNYNNNNFTINKHFKSSRNINDYYNNFPQGNGNLLTPYRNISHKNLSPNPNNYILNQTVKKEKLNLNTINNYNNNVHPQNIKKTFNIPKKNKIYRNGKTIEDKDINIDCDINLNNSNQITNSNNKNIDKNKINETISFYELNMINNINKDTKNNNMFNHVKKLNYSPRNDGNINVKNSNQHLHKVKNRNQLSLKPSNSMKNTKEDNNFNEINTIKIQNYKNEKIKLKSRKQSFSKLNFNKIDKEIEQTINIERKRNMINEFNKINSEINNPILLEEIEKKQNNNNNDNINNNDNNIIKIDNPNNNIINSNNINNNIINSNINDINNNSKNNNENNNNMINNNSNNNSNNNNNSIKKLNDNKDFNEIADNNQLDENIENIVNNIENYNSINHANSLEKSIKNNIPKASTGNIILLNTKIKENPNIFSITNNNKNLDKLRYPESEKNQKGFNPYFNMKRAKAKSNNININFINELNRSGFNVDNSKNNNIINNMSSPLEKNKNIITLTQNRNIIKTDRINKKSKSPSKLTSNIKNDNKIIIIKDKLNKNSNNENIISSDIENEDDNNKIKINSFKNKNKLLPTKENNIQNINSNNQGIIKNNVYTIETTKTNCSDNSINKENKIEIPKKINYFKKYKFDSLAGKDTFGKRKINQDMALAEIDINNIEGFNAFGVLDGHGETGHNISRFIRYYIINEIKNHFMKLKINSLSEIYNEFKKDDYSLIKKIYRSTDNVLLKQDFNSNFSGTTCVIVFQIGNSLITANVGDSRAILINTDNPQEKELKNTKIIELSIDQKPELPQEKKRIYKMGGIVDQMLDSKGKRNGPYRVWAGKENYPGLAMSRSIGDLKGKKCGIISTPEIIEYKLNDKSKYMVVCSDGVWEFLKNEDVMNIGNKFYVNNEIDKFLDEIIKLSKYWWEKEDIMRDDITAVIVFF